MTIKSSIAALQRPDTPRELAERISLNALFEQVRAEVHTQWPEITADNAAAVLDWQAERIRELRQARGL